VRRAFVLLVVVGAVLGVAVTSTRSRVTVRPAAAVGAWSPPQALVPASQYASDPQLAVSEQGATLAAWTGGPEPPPVKSSGPASVSSGAPSATRQAFSGSSVVVDTGTVSGGFGPPVVLAEHAAYTSDGLDIAISGAGVRYVAWQTHAGEVIASAASGGSFSAAHALLPGRDQLLRLVRSPAGPVAAVWFAWIGETPLLRYALLHPDGTLGRTVALGRWNGSLEGTPFALNDRGEFAALDMVGQSAEGKVPPAPLVHICNPAGHCSRPHELHFGHTPAGADENQAIALSNDGTVSVIASFSKVPEHPAANTPLGLLAAVRRPGKPWSAPQGISNGGEFPLAASDGNSSAVMVFQHFWTPKLQWLGDRIEISVLHAPGTRFAAPDLVRGEEAPNPAALATTMRGGLLVAWINSGGIVGGEHSKPGIYAVTGSAVDPGAPQLVASGEVGDETPAAGIDRDGQGVILWTGSAQTPPREGGVYASVYGVP
jgi:hypothetical protein